MARSGKSHQVQAVPYGAIQYVGGISTTASRVRGTLPNSGSAAIISDVQTREFPPQTQKKYQEVCLNTSQDEAREKKQKVEAEG